MKETQINIRSVKPKKFKCRNLDDLIEKYLLFWAAYYNLTEAEIETVKEINKLYYELERDLKNKDKIFEFLFSMEYRKKLRTNLNITNYALNNRIATLKTKKVILEHSEGYIIQDVLIVSKELNINFVIEENKISNID